MKSLALFAAALLSLSSAAQAADAPAAPPVSPPIAAKPAVPAQPFAYAPEELDMVIGKADAPVTIVEYASMSCPHCAHFHTKILPELQKNYIDKGQLRVVFRHFPLNEPAIQAAKTVLCTPEADRPKFLKVFFATQEKWAFDATYLDALQGIAAVGGFTPEQFAACQKDTELEKKLVLARKAVADKGWLDATPTFFINDQKMVGEQSVEAFAKVIDPLLAEKK